MQDTWDRPHYTNVQMPFPQRPPEVPDENPTGVYERTVRACPAPGRAGASSSTWARPRACSSSALNGREIGRQQGLAPRRGVRPHRPRSRPGENDAAADRGQVVRRHLRRGPGPVVARRHHAVGLPVRDRPDLPRRRPGRRRARAGPRDRDARARGAGGLAAGPPRSRAGASRRASRGSTARWAPTSPREPPPPGGPGDFVIPGPPRRGRLDLDSLAAAGALDRRGRHRHVGAGEADRDPAASGRGRRSGHASPA